MPPKTKKKFCEKCEKEKPATAHYFAYNNNDDGDGFKPICRQCGYEIAAERRRRRSEKSREWARANREKVHESTKRSYEKNREERLAYMKRWREQNKEKINEYQRNYYERKRQEQSSPG